MFANRTRKAGTSAAVIEKWFSEYLDSALERVPLFLATAVQAARLKGPVEILAEARGHVDMEALKILVPGPSPSRVLLNSVDMPPRGSNECL